MYQLDKNTEEAAIATMLLDCIWNADDSNICRVADVVNALRL